jgi:hypothetical protein
VNHADLDLPPDWAWACRHPVAELAMLIGAVIGVLLYKWWTD